MNSMFTWKLRYTAKPGKSVLRTLQDCLERFLALGLLPSAKFILIPDLESTPPAEEMAHITSMNFDFHLSVRKRNPAEILGLEK